MLSDTACKEIERLREFDDSGDEEQQPARINWIYTLKKDELVKDRKVLSNCKYERNFTYTTKEIFHTFFKECIPNSMTPPTRVIVSVCI